MVTGRVQGVGFRIATQEFALQLGLTGWIRNTPDGFVEVLAEGTVTEMASLEEWLWHGPPMSFVERIQVTIVDKSVDKSSYLDFRIR